MSGKRWLWRLILAGLILSIGIPLVGFGLSNLYLASPKGRIYLASKIENRTKLDTSIMGSSWSPWNGISVYGIRVEQPGTLRKSVPSPLLQIESVRVLPVWRALILNRQLLLKDIELRNPKLELPIELLSQLPSQPPIVSTPPSVAQVSPAPQPTSEPVDHAVASAPEVSHKNKQDKTASTIESIKETTSPTVWVKFSGAGLKITSAKAKEPLYQISNIEGALPLAGKRANSKVVLNKITLLGKPLVDTMAIQLKWRSPVLEIGSFEGELYGINYQVGAAIELLGSIPFRINAVLPSQENEEIGFGEQINAKLGNVIGQGVFQGQLAFPTTWQGQGIARAASISTKYGSQTAYFDNAQTLFIFRNGALSCFDARLVGEPLTLIGNATLLSDGRAAANGRIIAPPETLIAISKITESESSTPALTPLSTPQRSALDLQLFGKLGEFYFKPNPQAEPIPLN